MIQELLETFIAGLKQTTWLEFVAVIAGIVSVWFSRKENILVYPVGLINTVIYTYLSFKYHLLGEAAVNFYYTIMSVYGWLLWTKRDTASNPILKITFSTQQEWTVQILFFISSYIAIFVALTFAKSAFADGAIPWANAFASAAAFTGMWLMSRKKVESWYWWIATNIAAIPLYFVKGLVFTSVYYLVLLALAFSGLFAWRARAKFTR